MYAWLKDRLFASLVCCIAVSSLLGGCANLPSVSDLRAQRQQVRLASDSGRLSYSQSQAIVAKLSKTTEEADFLKRHLAVEEAVSKAPLVVGNRTTLLNDGPATYRAMLDAIRHARHYVHMESYIFDDDEVGTLFADALIERRRAGVAVSLMVDAVGTINASSEFFNNLRRQGVQVLIFNPLNPFNGRTGWSPDERNHRKLLVVDGEVGFVGGVNVSDVYTSGSIVRSPRRNEKVQADHPHWRDTQLRIEGPAVQEIEKVFEAGWRSQNGRNLVERVRMQPMVAQGPSIVRILSNQPGQTDSFEVYLTLMSAFQSAQKSIYITMGYFVPDPAFIQALQDAARRGVDVELILPGFSDSTLVFSAGRSYYSPLLDAGVKIYEQRDALLHAKTVVVDGVWATVGSSNMDWRSFTLNHEINAVVLGTAFAGQMQAQFAIDRAASTPIDPARWAARGLKERSSEMLSRFLERWL